MTGRNYLMIQVVDSVCAATGVTLDLFRSKRRQRKLTRPRQFCMYMMRHKTIASLPQIGRFLNRDHTTVYHGCNFIEQRLADSDPQIVAWHRAVLADLAGKPPRGRVFRDIDGVPGITSFQWGCPEGIEPPTRDELRAVK